QVNGSGKRCGWPARARVARDLGHAAVCSWAQRRQPRNPQEVVGARRQVRVQAGALEANEAALSQAADALQPAEDLLDALAGSLAHPVTRVPGRAAIEPRRDPPLDPRDVRADAALAQRRDERLRVIALVGTERLRPAAFPRLALEQLDRGGRLALPRIA